jgi:hypothetical protein
MRIIFAIIALALVVGVIDQIIYHEEEREVYTIDYNPKKNIEITKQFYEKFKGWQVTEVEDEYCILIKSEAVNRANFSSHSEYLRAIC